MDHTNFNDIPEMVDRETGNSNKAFDLLRGLEHDSAGHYASTTLEDFDADSGGDAGRGSFLERIKHRPAIAVVMLILLIALGFAAVRFWNYLQSYESTDDAQVDAHIDPISSRINGTITAVYVENNQRVKTGHLIVQLDPRDYEVAVEQARAQLAQAQANANSARQQYTSALAKIRQAQAEQFLAQRNQERISTLARLGVVAQAQYDQYNASARVDEADVSAEQADALSAQRAIASRDAQVKAAQAGLDQALLNLGYTRIAAPADGIIGKRSAELDERIQPGESLMALTR
jgi:membrane fusion protein, multidrug efflux system